MQQPGLHPWNSCTICMELMVLTQSHGTHTLWIYLPQCQSAPLFPLGAVAERSLLQRLLSVSSVLNFQIESNYLCSVCTISLCYSIAFSTSSIFLEQCPTLSSFYAPSSHITPSNKSRHTFPSVTSRCSRCQDVAQDAEPTEYYLCISSV